VILGKFLKQHQIPRESVVILTKTYNPDGTDEERGPAGMANQRGLNRKVSGSAINMTVRGTTLRRRPIRAS
jgi:aryl-alcohol dehydrogenase-like predicted oxidoreductase